MRIILFSVRKVSYVFTFICILLLFNLLMANLNQDYDTVTTSICTSSVETDYRERYFRPSNLPILNDKNFKSDFYNPYSLKKPSDIILPDELMKTPDDTLINYFSVLFSAANHVTGTGTGCGTLGFAKSPYPIAYNFLSSSYQNQLDYDTYLNTFQNILHINLIKYKHIPPAENNPNDLRYFVELETIEGSEKAQGYFAYYYGYYSLIKEGNQYRISNMELYPENYLCAPYHGWSYNAEYVVDIKYGNWCHLVEERYPTQTDGYVKKIYFKGTDEKDYLFIFFQLTNGTDIEIAQYIKEANQWQLIRINPEKCLEE